MPKANFVGDPLHRVDLRLSRRFPLGGRTNITGIVEMFNAFNHANYGSYTTDLANARYGLPSFNSNIAYQPRTAQFGFRLEL